MDALLRLTRCACHIVGLAVLVGVGGLACAQEAPVTPGHWQRVRLGPAGARYAFPIYSNRRLDGDLSDIKRVLVIQHGRARDGDAYYLAAEALMRAVGANRRETLLISPQFFSPQQLAKNGVSDFPAWDAGGFAGGEDAASPPGRISSFQVYDDLLAVLSDRQRFPALRQIVLAGHSGGAVLVQQFAALNHVDESVRAAGIAMRYVVANASAFLYFTEQRPLGSGFAAYDRSLCPSYNDHRYGFEKIARYAGDAKPDDAFRRYMARDVVYLFGLDDIDEHHPGLDRSCAAQAQGRNRLERGRAYLRHERDLAGSRHLLGVHRAFEVVGVGHDQQGMFSSACALRVLFEATSAEDQNGARCVETTTAGVSAPRAER